MIRKPVKYLTNKELLAEINECKKTYCSFTDDSYSVYDVIVNSLDEVDDDLIAKACSDKSRRITPKGADPIVVEPDGLIIRLMTYDHIPLAIDPKRKARVVNQKHELVPFPPYQHWRVETAQDGRRSLTEVGRSHWEGGLANGWFSPSKGRMTERMGRMYMMLVERYGRRGNFRGYSYNDDMQSLALLQLAQVGLQFDESKSSNPFAFYTTTINNCFVRILNVEKKQQVIRDDLLIDSGATPSMTRQVEHELSGGVAPVKAKRGRPTKVEAKAREDAEKTAD